MASSFTSFSGGDISEIVINESRSLTLERPMLERSSYVRSNVGSLDELTVSYQLLDVNRSNVTTAASATAAEQPYYVDVSRGVVFYSLALIIPFGLICNTLSIFVFMSKPLRMRAASWYLAALAVSDDLSLLTIMTEYWLKDRRIDVPIVKSSHALCVVVTHFSYVSRLLSAWLVMTFTIERFIGVVFPLRRAALSTTAHARKVILCECLACVFVTSYTIFTIGVVKAPYGEECDVLPHRAGVYLVFNIVFLVFGSIVVPILIVCTLNMFMLHKVYQRKRLFTPKNLRFRGTRQTSAKACRDLNVATLLLVVSTTFVILNAPYCIAWFLLFIQHAQISQQSGDSGRIRWDLFAAKYAASVPYYLNYSINFALYSLCARAFRHSVARILTCRSGCRCGCLMDSGGFGDTKNTLMEFYVENRNVEENGRCVIVSTKSRTKSKSRSSKSASKSSGLEQNPDRKQHVITKSSRSRSSNNESMANIDYNEEDQV